MEEIIIIDIEDLKPGMRLASTLKSPSGKALCADYTFSPFTLPYIKKKLMNWKFKKIPIYNQLSPKTLRKNINEYFFTSKEKIPIADDEKIIAYKNQIDQFSKKILFTTSKENKLLPKVKPLIDTIHNILQLDESNKYLMTFIKSQESKKKETLLIDHSINVMFYSLLLLNNYIDYIESTTKKVILDRYVQLKQFGLVAFFHDFHNILSNNAPWWLNCEDNKDHLNSNDEIFNDHIGSFEYLNDFPNKKNVIEIIKCHHEYDIEKKNTKSTAFLINILQVCDSYDIDYRRYHSGKIDQDTINEISENLKTDKRKITCKYYNHLHDLATGNITSFIED